METMNFDGVVDVAVNGIDTYKKMVISTYLMPLGMAAEMMDSFAKACKVENQYYVRHYPLGLTSWNQETERHPITEEGFYTVGKTLQNEELFLKDGRMFVIEDESKIINPVGYNVATMAGSSLRMMMQGITYTVDMLDQAARNIKFFLEFASFYGKK